MSSGNRARGNIAAHQAARTACAVAGLIGLLAIHPVAAQSVSGNPAVDPFVRPGGTRQVLPEFAPSDRPDLVLPPLAPQQPGGQGMLSSGLTIAVREIHLEGNTVFTDADLAYLVSPYEGRTISAEDLQSLRQQITVHYINAGFINSGAVIPDQDVQNGIVILRVIEGRVSNIEIIGNNGLTSHFVRSRLSLGVGPPLNMEDLEQRLQILIQSPFLEQVNAELGPGIRPGAGTLRVQVK